MLKNVELKNRCEPTMYYNGTFCRNLIILRFIYYYPILLKYWERPLSSPQISSLH